MIGKMGVRGCAWLVAMAFTVLLLERGVHHHASISDHHHEVPHGGAAVSVNCALCDMALPVFEPFAFVPTPSVPGSPPEIILGPYGAKPGLIRDLSVRGPPKT